MRRGASHACLVAQKTRQSESLCMMSHLHEFVCSALQIPLTWNGRAVLGLSRPTPLSVRCVAATFFAYHAVQFDTSMSFLPILSETESSDSDIDTSRQPTCILSPVSRRRVQALFSRAFLAAVSESGVNHKALVLEETSALTS